MSPPPTLSLDPPVLYQNEEQTITLLDIPGSISVAQGTNTDINRSIIYSCEPLQEPFNVNEPKSSKARGQFDLRSAHSELHSIYSSLINYALTEVRSKHRGDWCLARRWGSHPPRRERKRKASGFSSQRLPLEDAKIESDGHAVETSRNTDGCVNVDAVTSDARLTELAYGTSISLSQSVVSMSCSVTTPIPAVDASHADVENLLSRRSWDHVFHNPLHQQLHLILDTRNEAIAGSSAEQRFLVPERSTFVLGDCSDARQFRESIRWASQEYDIPRTFGFVLLDPPWPNASASRAKAYNAKRHLVDLERLLLRMDLDTYMTSESYFGVWITNKSAVRNSVLGKGGLFEAWNVCLKEEWLWVKVTTKGEPMTPLDGLWRKPYEVFLLGQRSNDRFGVASPSDGPGSGDVKRRVIVAVPDLHSRKPCLKTLIEPLIAARDVNYVLEIFARNLVAGWWSWGDEVLKFNSESCWTAPN
ncbi:MAG: hypothetical protein M1822_001815 [Bathelium mastoideum]|nr:MAG: hypothetical protein M1822_001815 [Bathelium mastoideum]